MRAPRRQPGAAAGVRRSSARPGLVLVLAVFAPGGTACMPDADLADEWHRGRAGAGAVPAELVDPPSGAEGVPPNLAALVVRLSVLLADGEAPFRVHGDDGALIPAAVSQPTDCGGDGRCYRLPLSAGLGPGRRYTLELVAAARAADGTPLPAGAAGTFATGTTIDADPPQLADLTLELLGSCVRARFGTDEAAAAQLVLRAGGIERLVGAGAGLKAFDVAASLAGLPADADGEAVVRVLDAAGNAAESAPWPLHTPAASPWPLVVTEVLGNPAGTEPTQEFVELRNVGAQAVTLGGLRLEDASGADVLGPVAVPAGAFVLVVPAGFNPDTTADVAMRPGTVLARVDSRLGGDGLTNAGEPVRLRSPDGLLLSSYGGFVDTSASAWNGRSVQRQGDEACDVPASWNKKPLGPTPGWE